MERFKVPCGWTAYFTPGFEVSLIGGFNICDNCGRFHPAGGFLVPVLNRWLCPNCFEVWSRRAKFYPSDVDFEAYYIKFYESRIPLNTALSDAR